jgi:hypothetical protein
MRLVLIIGLLFGLCAAASAQQPYAGLQGRALKALSPEQVEDLRAGRGMGLALAAELNGYPGPLHVLELAERLHLNADQRQRMSALFEAMKAEAIPLGEKLIAQETALDRQFAEKTITPATLKAMTDAIAATQGALRAAHLKYHLMTLDVLSGEQTRQYAALRGYGGDGGAAHGHGHGRRH